MNRVGSRLTADSSRLNKILKLRCCAFLLMPLLIVFFFSCMYSFRAGSLGGTLSIFPLENRTQNPDISRILTEGLIDAFIRDGRVKIKTGSGGDYMLEGVIDEYERSANSYTPEGEVKEYILSANVMFSLRKKDEEKKEWDRSISESFIYSVELDELNAVDSVAVKIKNSLLRFILEEW